MSDRLLGSERARLDPFVALPEDAITPRDQRDLMSQPFFSLAKGRRTAPILYETGGIRVEVHGFTDYGMATIWDADVLIWAASQIVEAADRGLKTSRFFRFTPYQLLVAIGRGPGQSQYVRLKRALQRLQSTVVLTTIRHGANWRRMQFSWINEWEELVDTRGHCHGMELVLPEWFYRGVLDRSLVLTIDPAYFALTGGIERWLYRIARRHAGHQPQGWAFELRHLYAKSGSAARFSDFALDLRRIIGRQPLPGYDLSIELDDRRELLRVAPRQLSTGTVDSRVEPIRPSGARSIRRSGATLSAHRAHEPQLSLWPATRSGPRNESNSRESNFSVVGARKAGTPADGAAKSPKLGRRR
ncbi:MAG TPA: replication initiator protein A [Stellaceae bacterium]|jgi:plasmid replication initiation protein|nr:replication initiator protein A [Stellaceae bacterium]